MSRVFLVGVDGSETASRAAKYAAESAAREDATVLLLYVVEWSGYEMIDVSEAATRTRDKEKEIKRAEKEILEPARKVVSAIAPRVETQVRHGHVAEIICEMAEKGEADQVFTGRRGRSKFAAMLLGGVTSSLIQACPVPVTVIP